jgi:hypothetical protein
MSREGRRRHLLHIYQGEQGAVIIVYSLNSNQFEKCAHFIVFARHTLIA